MDANKRECSARHSRNQTVNSVRAWMSIVDHASEKEDNAKAQRKCDEGAGDLRVVVVRQPVHDPVDAIFEVFFAKVITKPSRHFRSSPRCLLAF
jgi:hypothetical protein